MLAAAIWTTAPAFDRLLTSVWPGQLPHLLTVLMMPSAADRSWWASTSGLAWMSGVRVHMALCRRAATTSTDEYALPCQDVQQFERASCSWLPIMCHTVPYEFHGQHSSALLESKERDGIHNSFRTPWSRKKVGTGQEVLVAHTMFTRTSLYKKWL